MAYIKTGNRLMLLTRWFCFALEDECPDLYSFRLRTGYFVGWGRMPRVGGGQMYRHFAEDWVYARA